MVKFTSSYDRDAVRPVPGTLWAWEPDKPHAAALIRVTDVRWNGEEWYVTTRTLVEYSLPQTLQRKVVVNDLGRFWEACRYVNAEPGPFGRLGVSIRTGPPEDDELQDAGGGRG